MSAIAIALDQASTITFKNKASKTDYNSLVTLHSSTDKLASKNER